MTKRKTYPTVEGLVKRTIADNGNIMFFLEGERISNEKALDLIDRKPDSNDSTNNQEDTETDQTSKFDFEQSVRVLKGQRYKFRARNDEDKIITKEFNTVKLYDEFIVGEKEDEYPIKINHIQIIKGEV
ncbi:MAG: hypothetical protein ACLFUH_01215 [Bacteroidales bacterium]